MTKLEKLAQDFSNNVIAQTDAIRLGNSKNGNKYAKNYIRVFKVLQSYGNEGREALVPLMWNSREDVRGMAASFLLKYRQEEALTVLQELAKGEGLVAFSAQETLKRWKEGTWQLDS